VLDYADQGVTRYVWLNDHRISMKDDVWIK
jgi:hypothetical protein